MPIVVTVLGVVIVALAVALFTFQPSDTVITESAQVEMMTEEETVVVPNSGTAETTTDDPVAEVALATLSGTAKYTTPARITHDIEVSLTLEGNIVKDVIVNFDKGKGPANDYQKRFESSYRAEVVGKNISEVSLSRVGGASLTSGGFNEAVSQIREQI